MASNDTPQEVRELHNDMVYKISLIISPELPRDWRRLLGLFNGTPLQLTQMATIESIQDLFQSLMNAGKVDYGDYDFFVEKASKINIQISKTVEKYMTEISKVPGFSAADEIPGPSSSKRPRTQESPGSARRMVEKQSQTEYTKTLDFQNAKDKLVIKGKTWDVKTRLAFQLLAWIVDRNAVETP